MICGSLYIKLSLRRTVISSALLSAGKAFPLPYRHAVRCLLKQKICPAHKAINIPNPLILCGFMISYLYKANKQQEVVAFLTYDAVFPHFGAETLTLSDTSKPFVTKLSTVNSRFDNVLRIKVLLFSPKRRSV